jgi:hypothetical protein
MAADYVQALNGGAVWNDLLVVAPTHREAGHITGEIRNQLRDVGKLGTDEREFTRLVPVDTSEAERGEITTYRAGDVLVFHQNAKGGFTKGDKVKIADPGSVPVTEASKFALYRQEAIKLAAGDVIRFSSTVHTLGKDHTVRNGDAHAVAGFTEAGNIRLDNGWVVAKEAGHFRHGFVETSIGSQGRTVEQVILGMSAAGRAAISMQQLYVSASRASGRLRLYTDDKAEIRDAIQQDSQKRLALDLKADLPPEAEHEKLRRDGIARRQRSAVLNRMRAAWKRTRIPFRPLPPPTPPLTHVARVKKHERSYGIGH